MRLSNLNEVSNFSWSCQLLYEVLFVRFRWKLKHPETAISHRALLDHPRILNWPKSPHRLGLRIPFISNLKKPACASERDVLELATLLSMNCPDMGMGQVSWFLNLIALAIYWNEEQNILTNALWPTHERCYWKILCLTFLVSDATNYFCLLFTSHSLIWLSQLLILSN